MRLAGNHFSLVNDLASFDKELKEFESGKIASITNVVEVMQRVLQISAAEAKLEALRVQMDTEEQIKWELERLKSDVVLSLDEWLFVDAVLAMLGGHVFFCKTTSQYGGEPSRINPSSLQVGNLKALVTE